MGELNRQNCRKRCNHREWFIHDMSKSGVVHEERWSTDSWSHAWTYRAYARGNRRSLAFWNWIKMSIVSIISGLMGILRHTRIRESKCRVVVCLATETLSLLATTNAGRLPAQILHKKCQGKSCSNPIFVRYDIIWWFGLLIVSPLGFLAITVKRKE